MALARLSVLTSSPLESQIGTGVEGLAGATPGTRTRVTVALVVRDAELFETYDSYTSERTHESMQPSSVRLAAAETGREPPRRVGVTGR
jgi:hypothetical protein